MPTKNFPTQAEDLARKLYLTKCKELGVDKMDTKRLSYAGIYVRVWRNDLDDTMVASRPSGANHREYVSNSIAQISGNGLFDWEIDEITNCPEMMAIRQGYADEFNMLYKLRKQLTAVITACSTLKQATEALPEFIKYLPEEAAKTIDRTLPVVGNLFTDLSKAGWPKQSVIVNTGK